MTKQDWIEQVNLTTQKDWIDWIVIIISIVSPLITFFAVIYAAKSAKAAKDAGEITKQINEDAKSERELLRLPISELQNAIFSSRLTFDLVNINIPYPVSITSFGAAYKLDTKKINIHLVKVEMEHFLEEGKTILMTLYFTTISYDKYKVNLKMRRDHNSLFIDDYERQKIIAQPRQSDTEHQFDLMAFCFIYFGLLNVSALTGGMSFLTKVYEMKK